MKVGEYHKYKSYVGPIENYDLVSAMQFNLLTAFGLREKNSILDIGCGSLRAGKLFIPFLEKDNYVAIEPNKWLVEEGIKNELGDAILEIKTPKFHYLQNFELSETKRDFDFILAQSIFSHASIEQIEKCLKEAKKVLKMDGLFLATFVEGSENYAGKDWVYPHCVRYKPGFILKIIEKSGLRGRRLKWNHPNAQTWYMIYHPSFHKVALLKRKQLFSINKKQLTVSKYLFENVIKNKLTRKIYHFIKSIRSQ